MVVALMVALVCGVCGGCRWCRYSWCLWWLSVVLVFMVFVCSFWLVVFVVVVVDVSDTVQRNSKDLSEQSQLGKSEAKKRYENNIERGVQGFVDGDEENESEKEEELENEKEKEDDHQHNDNGSPMRRELISTSQHDPVKTFSIDRFQMGKFFEHFMKIMKNENIGELFKKSCFGHFLELPEDPSAHIHFPMMIDK
ncbi:hypothetical protein P3S67_028693 [Capsicum chacoense]